jgi:hypothetical protein
VLGVGVGECSSDEEKYRWRRAVNQAEWNETAEDRRRKKWKRGGRSGDYQEIQVRTNPADIANTVLKMSKKRAMVDGVLTVTAASDIFSQDLEDIEEPAPEPMRAPKPPAVVEATIIPDDGEQWGPAETEIEPNSPETNLMRDLAAAKTEAAIKELRPACADVKEQDAEAGARLLKAYTAALRRVRDAKGASK